MAMTGPELARLMKKGTRVKRGVDWKSGDDDGPFPSLGSVDKLYDDGSILVTWDTGIQGGYRMGNSGKYDLTLAQMPLFTDTKGKATASNCSWEQIEARFLYLEKKEKENSAEIVRLKRENVNLKLGNADLERKCLDLELGHTEVSERLKSALENLPPSKDEIFDRLGKAESETKRLRSKVDRFTKKNSFQVDKVKETLECLQKEVVTLRGLQKLLNSYIVKNQEGELERMVNGLQVKIKAIEDFVASVNNKVKTTNENIEETNTKIKAATDIAKASEGEIKALKFSVKAFEKDLDSRKKMTFKAQITTSKLLVTGSWMTVDQCRILYTKASPSFDKESCVFQCKVPGLYGIGLRLKQKGRGMLMARVQMHWIQILKIMTNADGDDCDRCFLHWFKDGDKLSVEVCRLSEEADVEFCQIAGFLVHPA